MFSKLNLSSKISSPQAFFSNSNLEITVEHHQLRSVISAVSSFKTGNFFTESTLSHRCSAVIPRFVILRTLLTQQI